MIADYHLHLRDEREEIAHRASSVEPFLAQSGVAVEVSTGGLRKPIGELYPDPRFLAACRDRDVPVTLASDAHVPALVGSDFDRALELLRSAGYETITIFEERDARQVRFDG